MIFEKLIDEDLGHVSYIVACGQSGEAFIVDPRRDTFEYEQFLEQKGLNLKYVFNTHTHADYIGGHIELALKYSIDNIFHYTTPIENFEILKAKESDEFFVGTTLQVTIIETPGHTPFDISLLVVENGVEKLLFTGDLLFIGDIGRPDLLGEESLEYLVESSYDSALKLWQFSDDIMVFSSHIEGSLCGKNLSRQYFSTIGIEKKTNESFSLSQESKERYIDNLLSQNIETPAFFKKMAGINIAAPKSIATIFEDLEELEFESISNKNSIQIVDLRQPSSFHKSHIQGSINIYEGSNVSLIAGNLLDYDQDIYLVGDQNVDFDLFIMKLLRVGFDNIKGIIQSDLGLIEARYLVSTQMVSKDEIDESFTNILLDQACSELGLTVQSTLSEVRQVDLTPYNRVFFSCNQGYKSSAMCHYVEPHKVFYIMD